MEFRMFEWILKDLPIDAIEERDYMTQISLDH